MKFLGPPERLSGAFTRPALLFFRSGAIGAFDATVVATVAAAE
jgi:hypothetical protein